MKKALQLLQQLPDIPAQLATKNFNKIFFNEHKEKEEPIETPGDVLRCAFDWEQSKEGYEYWCGIHESFGGCGSIEN